MAPSQSNRSALSQLQEEIDAASFWPSGCRGAERHYIFIISMQLFGTLDDLVCTIPEVRIRRDVTDLTPHNQMPTVCDRAVLVPKPHMPMHHFNAQLPSGRVAQRSPGGA